MNYTKTKDYLLCIDSDGCVMDAMDIKHIRAFGPTFVDVWELHEYKDEILTRWNEINLYSLTRGINRFKGMKTLLLEVQEKHRNIEDLDSIVHWVETTSELSEQSLEDELAKHNSPGLQKALAWSRQVNRIIRELPEDGILPFDGAYEAIREASKYCDIAVVSNANKEAVAGEWEKHGFMDYAKIILAQDAGSKSECIKKLMQFGYEPSKCMMVGDAKGDMDAAEKNGIFFYPVLVKHEKQSWEGFLMAVHHLMNGTLDDVLQQKYKEDFLHNLGA